MFFPVPPSKPSEPAEPGPTPPPAPERIEPPPPSKEVGSGRARPRDPVGAPLTGARLVGLGKRVLLAWLLLMFIGRRIAMFVFANEPRDAAPPPLYWVLLVGVHLTGVVGLALVVTGKVQQWRARRAPVLTAVVVEPDAPAGDADLPLAAEVDEEQPPPAPARGGDEQPPPARVRRRDERPPPAREEGGNLLFGHSARRGAMFIGWGILIVSPFVMFAAASDTLEAWQSRSWPRVPGEVYENDAKAEGSQYRVVVKYRYTVNGLQYNGSRVAPGGGSGTVTRAQMFDLQSKYQVRSRPSVAYDPANPSQSYLEPGSDPDAWTKALVALSMPVVGLAFVLAAFLARAGTPRRTRPRRR